MHEKIKFNVIIPTRERADTLFHSIKTILAQDYDHFGLIISDNCSQDNTKDVVNSFKDQRIIYIKTPAPMSMSHNWEFALNQVKEGWVIFLGDDDGLYPWALRILNEQINQYKLEAVSSSVGIFYWPEHFSLEPEGILTIPLSSKMTIKNSRQELDKAFSGEMSHLKLPWLYHGGAASIDLINRCRNEEGRFFCSQAPDMYSSVALSLMTDKFLHIGIPLAINGASKHSNGLSAMRLTSDRNDKPFSQFCAEDNIPLHSLLSPGKSLQVMLYDAYLHSWHLHQGHPNYLLQDQLNVAVQVSPPGHLQEIIQQCYSISTKNNLAWKSPPLRKRKMLSRIIPVWLELTWNIKDVKAYGIDNVYDASTISATMYKKFSNKLWLMLIFTWIVQKKDALLRRMI